MFPTKEGNGVRKVLSKRYSFTVQELCAINTYEKSSFVQDTLIMTKQQTREKEKFPDEVTTTVKVKLFPNKDQERLLSDTMNQYLKACNFVSEKVCELREHNDKEVQKVIYHIEDFCSSCEDV